MAQTALVRRADFHQVRIAATVPQSGYWFQQHMTMMSQYFARFLGTAAGDPAALAAMYMQLQRQALLWAFVDVFRWTALFAFLAAALTWLFQKVNHPKEDSGARH